MDASPYAGLAPYYDLLYAGVDYADDVRFLEAASERYARRPVRRVLDLGCGTGTHALLLAARGMDVVGLDLDAGLVARAREKAAAAPPAVAARLRFEEGDMARDLPAGPFDSVVSLFGSFNYLVEDARALDALRLARDRLAPGGLVALEFWDPAGVRPAPRWERATDAAGREVLYLIGADFDRASRVYRLRMELLVLDGGRVAERVDETHALRTRTRAEMQALVERAGLEHVAFARGDVGAKSLEPPPPDAMRVMALARRP